MRPQPLVSSMHAVSTCLILLALAAGASLLGRMIRLKLPFAQIGIGVVAALPPFGMQVALDPSAFLLLFIPPILFSDGWTTPRRALRELRWPVLGHAVGLVLLTVAVAGAFLHWMIPSMPLSVAFALAALVSPTDAVAVSAITEGISVPSRMMHLLENEALLNDATGLVSMRFAVAATLSGAFSLPWAALTFVIVGGGGLAVGWGATLIFAWLHRRWLHRPQDAAVQTVLAGLLPYLAYELAEHAGLSGILAASGGGLAASRISLLEGAHFTARLQTNFTWGVVSFGLNGVIFVLLGLQLPGIIGSGPNGINLITSEDRLTVLGQIGALTLCLIVLRMVWVLASVGLSSLLRQWNGRVGWRVITASGLAGVRGAVTLAGVLSLPLALPDGRPFPSRNLAITLASGVILASMLIAAVALPLLLRGYTPPTRHSTDPQSPEEEIRSAREQAAEAAIAALTQDVAEPDPRRAAIVDFYKQQLAALRNGQSGGADSEAEGWRDVHRAALLAERKTVRALQAENKIDDTVARQLLGELDLLEAVLTRRPTALTRPHSRSG